MNIIHYMHDKYCLREEPDGPSRHATVRAADGLRHRRPVACMADSLSAIKYAKVKRIRDPETGLIVDFETEGDFPKFGNDDDRVDQIACEQVREILSTPCASTACTARRRAHPVHPDHHLQRDVRQKDRHHPRRPKARRAPGPRRQPHVTAGM